MLKQLPNSIKLGALALFSIVTFFLINPFAINDAGERTVVQQIGGKQYIQFSPGIYYQGFFAKATSWPNQISVTYQAAEADYELDDNGVEVGKINIRFNDATTADVKGITQFILPSDEKDMIFIHNTHRTPQSLVQKRLAPYTKECLQSSSQLLSSEMHYGGGRAQMAQDFLDQLQNGVFLLNTEQKITYDSVEKEKKRIYLTEKQIDKKSGVVKRKQSSIAEYGVSVADAAITDVDYEAKVDEKLVKIIDAVTKAAISKQDLMTAQQQALTAKVEGEKKLVEIEYATKQDQTKQVVEAQTEVEVAKQNKLKQQIAYESMVLEAKTIKEKAEAEAFAKKSAMIADGALDTKLKAYVQVQQYWADAFAKHTNSVVPYIVSGGGSTGNGAVNFMEILGAKAAKDLAFDLKAGK